MAKTSVLNVCHVWSWQNARCGNAIHILFPSVTWQVMASKSYSSPTFDWNLAAAPPCFCTTSRKKCFIHSNFVLANWWSFCILLHLQIWRKKALHSYVCVMMMELWAEVDAEKIITYWSILCFYSGYNFSNSVLMKNRVGSKCLFEVILRNLGAWSHCIAPMWCKCNYITSNLTFTPLRHYSCYCMSKHLEMNAFC